MEWYRRRHYHLACGSALFALVLLAGGATWQQSFLYAAMSENSYVRIIATLLLVTSLAWLTDVVVDSSTNKNRALFWLLGNGVLVILLCWELWRSATLSVAVGKIGTTNFDNRSMLFFLVVVYLFVLAAWVGHVDSGGPEGNEDRIRRWGRMASLIIMILALYAFGLRYSEAHGKLEMHWSEVPAILVVFILSELGVHLVMESRRIACRVEKATSEAKDAGDTARTLVEEANAKSRELKEEMNKVLEKGQTLIEHLGTVSNKAENQLNEIKTNFEESFKKIIPIEETGCFQASSQLYAQLGMDSKEYWGKIGLFAGSWNPRTAASPETKALLNTLFTTYLGQGEEDGSVWQKDSRVSCITADTVFADASEKWLDEMVANGNADRPLIVWAITKLLPTEFALPLVWLGTNEAGEKASRVQSLERFIGSVIEACRKQHNHLEYRRVTVFEDQEKYVTYSKKRKVSEWLGKNGEPDGIKPDKEEGLLENSLKNWMIWDPRVQPDDKRSDRDKHYWITNWLVRALLRADLKEGAFCAEKPLQWSNLADLLSDKLKTDAGFGEKHHARVLPFLGKSSGPSKEVFLFRETPQRTSGAKVPTAKEMNLDRLIFGSSEDFLGRLVSKEDLQTFEGSEDDKHILTQGIVLGKTKTEDLLKALGWQSIGDWYCNNLHTRNTHGSEAWWVIMDGWDPDKKERDIYFDPLRLDRNGASTLTLDLLLIGFRDTATGLNEWHGAVISNLDLERAECTVQLVTRIDQLNMIGEVVDGLCEGREQHLHGRWDEWPAPRNSGQTG